MKKARMNISHSRFILSKLKIFGEIVTTNEKSADEYFSFSFYSLLVENFRWNSHYLK